jgi:hypothetical protein
MAKELIGHVSKVETVDGGIQITAWIPFPSTPYQPDKPNCGTTERYEENMAEYRQKREEWNANTNAIKALHCDLITLKQDVYEEK